MTLIDRISNEGVDPEISRPDGVLEGDPVHSTWNLETHEGRLHCGVWKTTPGKWKVSYSEWEYIYIHVGHSILTDAAGVETHLMSGDSFVIRPGFSGTWECVEETLKDYVILE